MPKSFAVVGLLLALFFVGPLAVYAQEGAWRFGAVQIISGIELDAQPVIAATPEGEIVVAWAQAASQGKGATIYAAKGPRKWSPRPIADLALTDDVLTLYLSTDIKGRPHLAWSYPLTDTFVLAEWGLEDGQPIRERTIERIGRMAFALDASDGLYYMRSTDRAVTYHGPREEFTATLELAEGDLVRETSLGVGPKGQGYLTWTTVNQASGASAVFGAQAISGTLPIHLGSGRAPHIVVSPGGRAHLLWRHEDALYYANSVDWSRLYVLDTGLSTDDVHTLIVGPDEVAHAFWVHEGALWHATSLDWRLTKNMITAPVEVEHLAATVDGAGQSHIVWSAKGGEGGHTLYYLNPKPISPQLAVTYPLAGALLGPKTLAQAVSNLPPAELLRVEFYLQAQNQLVAGDDDALLALGVDDDGSDGWAVPLDGDRLYPTDRYRVIALATDRDGNTLQAVGEWFEAHSRQEAGLFLRAEGPQPLRQWASLSLIGRMPAEASTQLDLFFLPTECTASEPVRRGAFPLTEQARYLGVYELRPAGDGFIQQSLSFDSRRLPDGCYVPFALFRDGAMRYVYGDNTKPLRVENASPPTVHILSPLPGQLIRETLEILVDAEDADGLVKRVDFYLQRELGPLRPPQRLWLGCDDKAEEGWRLAVTIDEPLDGENWQILVTAIDDDRLTSAPAIIGPIDLVGRQRPQLSILRPTAGRPLYDVESVRVFVLQGGEYIEGIDLYAQEADGPLRPVGAMERVDAAWECPWDTRQWPDGTYRLYALARHTDGRRTLVSTPGLTVLNQAPIAGIVQPRAGELLAGWTLVRVQGGGASAPIAALRFYCRDAQGELYRIGEDLSADNGWALAWNTRTVIDGDYDLLVEVKDAEEHTTWLRCPVRVRNDAPMLEEGSLKLPDRVSDVQKIAWATRTSAGGPMTATLEYSPDLGVHWLPIAQDLAADGEFVWDTRAAPDSFAGLLRLTLGNRGHVLQFLSNPFTLNNVNDPPFIALLAPGAEVVPRGDIPVRWRAWDADGDPITIDVEYRRGTEPWRPLASGLANTGSYLWRAAGLAPANDYALRVVARDSKGALGSDAVRGISIVNNRPPEVTVLWPTEHTSVTTEAILLWRAVDPDGDALTIDLWYSDDAGQTWLPLAEGLPNTGYYVWQVAFLPLGSQYRVRLVARDRYFQSIDDSDATFAIGRNPPPRLALLEPGPGEAVHGLRLIRWSTLNPNASQLGIVPQIRPKGATAWEALSDVLPDDGFFLWDTTRYAEGDYELRLIARDAVGLRAASAPSEVRVMNHTNHPPHVELISPLGGEHWSGLRRISWRAWDPDGDPITATVQLSADDGYTWQTLARTDARHGLYVWDTRTAPPARQYLLAVAVDDGQATAKALTPGVFYLQSGRSHPPHLLVTSPDPAGQLTRNNLVTWLAEDLDGEDLSVDLLLSRDEGRTWEGIVRRMANVGEFILDRRWLSGSAQRLRLLVSDGIRRTYVDMPLRLSGDGERGGIEILSPLGGETWSGEQAIRWRIGASAMRTAPIVLELSGDGGQTWLTVHRGIGADTFLWDTTQVPNGTYLLRATIQNGKQTWTATGGPFDIRNAGRNLPSVSVLEPREGDIWSGTRVIRWYARDPDGDPLSVNLAYSIDDGQSWRPLGYAPIDTGNYVWDTSTAPNCSRVWVRVTVSDGRFIAQATSIGPFAIRNGHAPTVRLISPKGGEQWTGIGEIRWEAIYESTRTPQVILQYSLDRGRTWQPLAENLPPAGIYRWNSALVPEESRVLLRAMATDGLEGGVDMLLQPITVRGNASPVSLPFYLR